MLSRALSSATVMLLIAYFAAIPVQAQNLEAGKSPSQIFAGTCTACHKSPRGLLKTVPAGSLPGVECDGGYVSLYGIALWWFRWTVCCGIS